MQLFCKHPKVFKTTIPARETRCHFIIQKKNMQTQDIKQHPHQQFANVLIYYKLKVSENYPKVETEFTNESVLLKILNQKSFSSDGLLNSLITLYTTDPHNQIISFDPQQRFLFSRIFEATAKIPKSDLIVRKIKLLKQIAILLGVVSANREIRLTDQEVNLLKKNILLSVQGQPVG